MSAKENLVTALVQGSLPDARQPVDDDVRAKHNAHWNIVVDCLARHIAEVDAWVLEVTLERAQREERDRAMSLWGNFVAEIREDYAQKAGGAPRVKDAAPVIQRRPRPMVSRPFPAESVAPPAPARVVAAPVAAPPVAAPPVAAPPVAAPPVAVPPVVAPPVTAPPVVSSVVPGTGYRAGRERRLVMGAAFVVAGILLALAAALLSS